MIENQARKWNNSVQPLKQIQSKSEPEILTRTSQHFFLLSCFLLVLPAFDVPLLGVSLTAPLIGLMLLEILFRPRFAFIQKYRAGLIWAFLFITALSVVQAVTATTEALQLTSAFLPVIRFIFWIFTFIAILYVSYDGNLMKKTALMLGFGILVLAFVRVGEALLFDKWGAWTHPRFITQNAYGVQFSTFIPFGIYFVLMQKGFSRFLGIGMLFIVLFALLMNGSRSSWIAVTVSVFVMGLIYSVAKPKYMSWFLFISAAAVVTMLAVYPLLPDRMRALFEERIETINDLDSDKSFLVRELMIQKGIRLFLEDPFFGAGLNRFSSAFVRLDIPAPLRYGSQQHFNVKSAHNGYIMLLGETGLFGTVPFATLFLTAAVGGAIASVKLVRYGYSFAPCVYAAFCGMSIHLWALAGLMGTAPWFIYGFVIGLIYLARSQSQKNNEQASVENPLLTPVSETR